MPRCFVMQPFDGAEFDRRYDEIYKLAIEEAGFEPYRVDRDPSAAIPVEAIENGIRAAAVCFVDITHDNPNVWFEFGYAICAKKPFCIICGQERGKFPFDIQHRSIIRYSRESLSDFATLRSRIVERLKAVQSQDSTLESIIQEPTLTRTGPLSAMELSALCVLFELQDCDADVVTAWAVSNDMERAGYTKLATKIALKKLEQADYIEAQTKTNEDGAPYAVYGVTAKGSGYIIANTHRLRLRREGKASKSPEPPAGDLDDNIPF